MKTAVIFDLDGTLVNAYHAVAVALNRVLRELEIKEADDHTIQRSVGWGERHLLGCFVCEEKLDKAVELYRKYHKETLPEKTIFLPGAAELLKTLKEEGFSLNIATNRPVWSTSIILDCLGTTELFDIVLSGEEVNKQKPEPDVLNKVIEKLGIGKEDALYVGDMTVDAQTGSAAGVDTVIVTTGSSTKDEIAAENPLRIIDNVIEVKSILDEMKASVIS